MSTIVGFVVVLFHERAAGGGESSFISPNPLRHYTNERCRQLTVLIFKAINPSHTHTRTHHDTPAYMNTCTRPHEHQYTHAHGLCSLPQPQHSLAQTHFSQYKHRERHKVKEEMNKSRLRRKSKLLPLTPPS